MQTIQPAFHFTEDKIARWEDGIDLVPPFMVRTLFCLDDKRERGEE